jgi:crotonobetainyl-CoA:carnitine CoA-transferase CaiB-like acyl-CoA transferase
LRFKASKGVSIARSPPAGDWTSQGEQTEEVLTEFGFSAQEIAELRQGKVV